MCQHNGCSNEEKFIKLERTKVESKLGDFPARKIVVGGDEVKTVKQEGSADEVERIANEELLHPVNKRLLRRSYANDWGWK
ncbi:hypothetical protein Cflav_PD0121 [Pedosphaera parvula Ellin514]|uniref:Uncharacterized protein n=2 Tax=Pedosphaera TaxID=1032526 RepID=B9XSU9_PEDPL|nr:hypothetical protein Cflav_PD0121 [Pedosphaera parvula Ellin514]